MAGRSLPRKRRAPPPRQRKVTYEIETAEGMIEPDETLQATPEEAKATLDALCPVCRAQKMTPPTSPHLNSLTKAEILRNYPDRIAMAEAFAKALWTRGAHE